jgi:hypothetical protein
VEIRKRSQLLAKALEDVGWQLPSSPVDTDSHSVRDHVSVLERATDEALFEYRWCSTSLRALFT